MKPICFESEEWSSQLIFQFKQLERRSLKKSGLQRDSNPWPPRYRCDALQTELWSHTLGARSINWVHIFPWRVKWCKVYMKKFIYELRLYWISIQPQLVAAVGSSVGRASHRYRGGHGFESRWSPDFFRLLLSNCLNWKINCDDHSSLSIQPQFIYEFFHINFTSPICFIAVASFRVK